MSAPRDLLVVSSFAPVTGSPAKMNLIRYFARSPMPPPLALTIPSGPGETDIHPTVVADNEVNPTSGIGGSLFAWTRTVPTGPNSVDVRTLTLRCVYPMINNVITPVLIGAGPTNTPLDLHPTIVSGGYSTYPDIAYASGPEPSSIIAWQGRREDACGFMSKKILSQHVLYGLPNIQTVWPEPRYVSPGPDNFDQSQPTLTTLHDNTNSAFWYDLRAQNAGIAFTRLFDDASDIAWSKRQINDQITSEEATEALLYLSYPNPVSLSEQSSATIPIFLPEEGYVILRIYNMYGQLIETLQDGYLNAGSHSFRFIPAVKGLPSGMYFYSMITTHTTRTRTMHIVH